MQFDILDNKSTPELQLLKDDASNVLFELQNNPDIEKITYWTEVFTMCKTIINGRENGSK